MSALTRFLGDTVLRTVFKLAILSFLVGFVMVYLYWRPRDVFVWIGDLFGSVWDLGLNSIEYLALGAAVVVPLFLVIRLLSWRGRTG